MDPLDDLLKTTNYSNREPLPEGFEERILSEWFERKTEKKKSYAVFAYAVAACLATFTCINILSLQAFDESESEVFSGNTSTALLSSETEFAEAYGLVETTSYYTTLNK